MSSLILPAGNLGDLLPGRHYLQFTSIATTGAPTDTIYAYAEEVYLFHPLRPHPAEAA